jgi:succinyl-diaminopimelate desuccinylase
MALDPIILTQQLIKISSPDLALEFVSNILKKLDFTCEILNFNGIKNLFAQKKIGTSQQILAFLGHVDVVPTGDSALWYYPPFSGEIFNNAIYGRGAADMKGGIACFLSALEKINTCEQSIILIITCDEEGIAKYGTKATLDYLIEQKRLPKIHFALVGEPTSREVIGDHIKIGGRGSLNVKVTAKGKSGHVAYFADAINPIPYMLSFLTKLIKTKFDIESPKEKVLFEPTHLEITSIDVKNQATNVIPETIEVMFNIRFSNQQNIEKLTNFIEKTAKKSKCVEWSFCYDIGGQPFLSKTSDFIDKLTQICRETAGIDTAISTNGANSDAGFLGDLCPFAELGFLVKQAHTINEHVKISDILMLSEIFFKFLCCFTDLKKQTI